MTSLTKANYRDDVDELGWDPIHIAAFNGNLNKLTQIFNQNPFHNPKTRDPDGKTALHIAVAQTSISLIKLSVIPLLLQNNQEINAQDQHKSTALHVAAGSITRNTRTTSRLLSPNGVIHCPATKPQSQASLNTIKALYTTKNNGQEQLDLEIVDESGKTPLLIASQAGNVQVIEYLLSIGCDSTVRDHEGRTALHLCSGSICDADANAGCKLLLTAGCDLNDTQWTNGTSPEKIATTQGNTETTRMLIGIKRTKGRERRALFKRAQSHVSKGTEANIETLRMFLQDSNNCSQVIHFKGGNRGATLLLDAVKHDRASVVEMLLQHGADIHDTTKTGKVFLFKFLGYHITEITDDPTSFSSSSSSSSSSNFSFVYD